MISFLFLFLAIFIILIWVIVRGLCSKKTRKFTIVILILPILVLLSLRAIKGFIPLPNGVRNLVYLAMPPEDLYEPILEDNFLLYEKGFTKTYSLKFKYLVSHHIGFLVKNRDSSSQYKFSGKVRADFFWKDKLLFSEEMTSHFSAGYAGGDMKDFSDVRLMRFDIPLQGKYKDDINVRLTVLEPDESLKQYGDSIRLFVKVGGLE